MQRAFVDSSNQGNRIDGGCLQTASGSVGEAKSSVSEGKGCDSIEIR